MIINSDIFRETKPSFQLISIEKYWDSVMNLILNKLKMGNKNIILQIQHFIKIKTSKRNEGYEEQNFYSNIFAQMITFYEEKEFTISITDLLTKQMFPLTNICIVK